MIGYAEATNKCRSQALLAYFGECDTKRCGRCDVCIKRNKLSLNEMEFDRIVEIIKPVLRTRACSMEDLVIAADPIDEDKIIRAVQWLIDNEKIITNSERKFTWK